MQTEYIINSYYNGQFKQMTRQIKQFGVAKFFRQLADDLHEIESIELYWKISVSFYNSK